MVTGVGAKFRLYQKGKIPPRPRFAPRNSKIQRANAAFFSMKMLSNFSIVALFSSVTFVGQAQQTTSVPSQTPYAIVSRDANSRVWERTTYDVSPSGQTIPHLHRYTELGTGLCYQRNGQWLDSLVQISIQPDGTACATNGQHQVFFPSDIGNGVIKMVTPDGSLLRSQ